jgi:PPOX class probable F420-dependent enzyme
VRANTGKRPLKRLGPLCERLPGGQATLAGVPHASSNSVLYLSGAKYLLMESERANGEWVATPLCFAGLNERVFVRIDVGSAKVIRIERRPIVKVAACTFRGTPINDFIECMARILPCEREPEAKAALCRQYGLVRRLFSTLVCNEHTYLELTPLTAEKPVPENVARGAAIRAVHQARYGHAPGAA